MWMEEHDPKVNLDRVDELLSTGAQTIGGARMADATYLATFYANEAARLLDANAVSRTTSDAETLRLWLLEGWDEPFISASDSLLVDRALPMPVPHKDPDKIMPCTTARAMPGGWMFEVPPAIAMPSDSM